MLQQANFSQTQMRCLVVLLSYCSNLSTNIVKKYIKHATPVRTSPGYSAFVDNQEERGQQSCS